MGAQEQVSFLLVMFFYFYFFCYNLQEDMFLNSISFPSVESRSAGNTPWSPVQTHFCRRLSSHGAEMNEELQSSRWKHHLLHLFSSLDCGVFGSFVILKGFWRKISVDVLVLVVK